MSPVELLFQIMDFLRKKIQLFYSIIYCKGEVIYKRHKHSIEKFNELRGLSDDFIHCTIDAVGLCPSVPLKEWLEAI